MNPDVSAFIEQIAQPWQVEVATALRDLVHDTIPDVQERIQYKKPHFLKDGHYAAVISPAKAHLSFTVFNTQDVAIPDGLFDAGGPTERRNLKIKEGQAVDYDALAAVLKSASDGL